MHQQVTCANLFYSGHSAFADHELYEELNDLARGTYLSPVATTLHQPRQLALTF